MKNRTVLISGASVAGPALAFWLWRYGFTPTVVERAPSLRDGGQAVDVRGVAIEVARRMGILEDVRAARTGIRGQSYVDARGRRVATMDASFGVIDPGDVELLRGDLTRILYDATRNDVEYLFGDSITAISQGDDEVKVSFARSEPRTFDLVVGADGLHSGVRELTFGDERAFLRHLGVYVSIFTIPNDLGLDHWQLSHSMPGRMAAVTSARGNTEARAIFFFASPELAYDHRDTGRKQQLLGDAFAGAGWEVPRLLEAMPDAADFYFDSSAQVHLDSWSRGRVTLLGDAAYCGSPLSGQGTSLALTGAYVLAGELAAAGGDHVLAYPCYENRFRDFAERNQRIALGMVKRIAPSTRRAVWLQRQGMRLLPYLPGKNLIFKLATREVKQASNALDLRDYAELASVRPEGAGPSSG